VRLIAATNKDLKEQIDEGKFRSDLYFRINVIPITMANLCERPEDILPLAEGILAELNRRYSQRKFFSDETKEKLLTYKWPGNVRELRNVVERMIITQTKDELTLADEYLETPVSTPANTNVILREVAGYTAAPPTYTGTIKEVIEKTEHAYIDQTLKQTNGSVSEAAKILGIHRSVLYRKLQK
jgi:DNA-binding NtrC family response regulator